jgi:creatinine amidohydrolase
MLRSLTALLLASALVFTVPGCAQQAPRRGVELSTLTWIEAERRLTPDTVVVIPLGAEAKEHGPHLQLQNDFLLAQYFRERVLERSDVVVAPTINYHFYPAFVEYPGSTTLRLETARDLVVDVVTSLARHGPKRFYVLNTGVSTVRALGPAAEELAKAGILMRFTKLDAMVPVERELLRQERGTHADEGETSMMLVIAPHTVDMSKAVKDTGPKDPGPLSRDPESRNYTPSGVFGDATLATRAKGERLAAAFTELVVKEIEALRAAPLPR